MFFFQQIFKVTVMLLGQSDCEHPGCERVFAVHKA